MVVVVNSRCVVCALGDLPVLADEEVGKDNQRVINLNSIQRFCYHDFCRLYVKLHCGEI